MSVGNVNLELERSDIGLGLRSVSQTVEYDDFTDNEDTTGSLTMTNSLPEGAFVIGTKVTVTTGFTGDTSATLKVGKSDGEDEFSDGTTINVYTADVVGDSAEDPLEYLAADTSVYLQITSGSDFTSVTAGKMTVEVFYLSTAVELG